MIEPMTEEDLDYIYVLIPNSETGERDLMTVTDCSDQQFRWWITGMGRHHGIQMLPSLGRIGMETRLGMINRLIRNGVKIHKLAKENRLEA